MSEQASPDRDNTSDDPINEPAPTAPDDAADAVPPSEAQNERSPDPGD